MEVVLMFIWRDQRSVAYHELLEAIETIAEVVCETQLITFGDFYNLIPI